MKMLLNLATMFYEIARYEAGGKYQSKYWAVLPDGRELQGRLVHRHERLLPADKKVLTQRAGRWVRRKTGEAKAEITIMDATERNDHEHTA